MDADYNESFTPTVPKTASIPLDDTTKKKLRKDNKLAWIYLLNNMFNPLFDLFVNFKSAKMMWTKLDTKFDLERHRKEKICRQQVAAECNCRS